MHASRALETLPRARWRRAVVALLLLGSLAQTALASTGDAPEQLLQVGEHRLHIHCIGRGTPVVVPDAGVGASLLDWIHVQPMLAVRTTTRGYDHAAFGYSEAGPRPRTATVLTAKLRALLDARVRRTARDARRAVRHFLYQVPTS